MYNNGEFVLLRDNAEYTCLIQINVIKALQPLLKKSVKNISVFYFILLFSLIISLDIAIYIIHQRVI